MYYFGYICIVVAMLVASGAAFLALINLWNHNTKENFFLEKAHIATTLALFLAGACLLHGLYWQDYSLVYAASYTDRFLSLFYRLTAFWAGQPGSMLFWAMIVSLSASIFAFSRSYVSLDIRARNWFWFFQQTFLVFFTLLLTTYSNPFIMQFPAPADGNGLNPLLQNPGMIIHPPLLFIGYAGFIVPTCLALAEHMGGSRFERPWFLLSRSHLLLSWMFLTAGIMLGAWWAYMELGWGGYWAWDPVENSSLVPWLLATALLHTLIIERQSKKFSRFNLFLMVLVTLATLFATYLVRSGIIDSVHAFGQGAVGFPLLCAIIVGLIFIFGVTVSDPFKGEAVTKLLSREAFLSFMSWFLIALAFIITLATLWPVITKFFASTRGGLDASFYNRVCLPLAAVALTLLAFCPWIRQNFAANTRNRTILLVLALSYLVSIIALWYCEYRNPVAMAATAAAVATGVGLCILLFGYIRKKRPLNFAAFGAHLGLVFCAFGVAFSGPYSVEKDILFTVGEAAEVGEYLITLDDVRQENGAGYAALLAKISVERDDKPVGFLVPERRIYEKFGDMQFSEVDTIFSFGNELYVSLLGLTADKKVLVRFSIKPLVNWLWVGGIVMSLLPLLGLLGSERGVRDSAHTA